MADLKMALTQTDMSKWASRIASEDWAWVTWKYFLGDTFLFLLWLSFLCTFISMLVPSVRIKLVSYTRLPVNGSVVFSAFVITWLIGSFSHAAIFSPGPYSYWLQSWLGVHVFDDVASWTHKYLTLFGVIFLFGSL